jgi:hypothetical protein
MMFNFIFMIVVIHNGDKLAVCSSIKQQKYPISVRWT